VTRLRLHRPLRGVGTALSVALLGGCTSLSGLNGRTDYACKAPEGVTCQSVSGTYANTVAHPLPSQSGRTRTASVAASAASAPDRHSTAVAGTPLRSPPRILRLWFKPWEDADRDLFDQGYVYVQVDGGRWLVEHAQRAIREAHAPVHAGPGAVASPPAVVPLPPSVTALPPVQTRPTITPVPVNRGQSRE
jgi:conjugal transfer pilus assembly protein TraV